MSQLFPCAVAVVHELVIADLVSRSRSSSTARFPNGGGGVRHEVEADDTRWLRLVEQDVFEGRPQGRYSGGAQERASSSRANLDERGRSVATRLDAGEHHAHAAGPTMQPVTSRRVP